MQKEQDVIALIKNYINGTSSQDADVNINKIHKMLKIADIDDLQKIRLATNNFVMVPPSNSLGLEKRKEGILECIDKIETRKNSIKIALIAGGFIVMAAIIGLFKPSEPVIPNISRDDHSEKQTSKQIQVTLETPITVDFSLLKSNGGLLSQSEETINDQGVIKPDELFWLTFTPKEQGYVYFFLVDPLKQTYALFPPNSDVEDILDYTNPVRPNEQYDLPNANSSYVKDETSGKHIIYSIFLKNESEQLSDIAKGLLSYGKIEHTHVLEKQYEDLKEYIRTIQKTCTECVRLTRFFGKERN